MSKQIIETRLVEALKAVDDLGPKSLEVDQVAWLFTGLAEEGNSTYEKFIRPFPNIAEKFVHEEVPLPMTLLRCSNYRERESGLGRVADLMIRFWHD